MVMEGGAAIGQDHERRSPYRPGPRSEHPDGPRPEAAGDLEMSRLTPVAFRVAVLVAFVLVLAAPFRWH
jgi:hypothetical protein